MRFSDTNVIAVNRLRLRQMWIGDGMCSLDKFRHCVSYTSRTYSIIKTQKFKVIKSTRTLFSLILYTHSTRFHILGRIV